jgi:hypothetical protein
MRFKAPDWYFEERYKEGIKVLDRGLRRPGFPCARSVSGAQESWSV